MSSSLEDSLMLATRQGSVSWQRHKGGACGEGRGLHSLQKRSCTNQLKSVVLFKVMLRLFLDERPRAAPSGAGTTFGSSPGPGTLLKYVAADPALPHRVFYVSYMKHDSTSKKSSLQ